MSDDVKENSETSEKVDTNSKASKIGCSHYARKCILIVSGHYPVIWSADQILLLTEISENSFLIFNSVSVSVSLSLKAVETLWYNSSVVNDLSINSQVWFVSVARA